MYYKMMKTNTSRCIHCTQNVLAFGILVQFLPFSVNFSIPENNANRKNKRIGLAGQKHLYSMPVDNDGTLRKASNHES